jgi:hypothetical protein
MEVGMSPEKTSTMSNDRTKEERAPQNMKIDPDAPAGSKNSLGAQSVRDGRPDTDDSVVEAMDEMGPGIEPDLEPRR